MKRAGIFYHPKREEAVAFSQKLEEFFTAKGITCWRCSAWEPETVKQKIPGTELILSLGGDGTILRTARAIIPEPVPILGINMGRLGFMAELMTDDAMEKLPSFMNGKGWVEERAMIKAELFSKDMVFHALNDVFIGRRSSARLVTIDCKIDGQPLASYRADGIIIATASGSTGYSSAAGGPTLHPEAKDIILQPVCAHLTFNKALVLLPQAVIDLKVTTSHEAMISIDGQRELPLSNGDEIRITLSAHKTRLLRIQPRDYFYRTLESRLQRKIT
jgi:NAD+ kinase